MSPEGIVILDDILNQGWTGVVTGACEFFSSNLSEKLVPFAIGFNKLFCCHFTQSHKLVQQTIGNKETLSSIGISLDKITEFAGHQIVSLRRA